jgi:hypothetical protein
MDHATNKAVYDRVTQNQMNKANAQMSEFCKQRSINKFAELTQYHFGRPK